MRPAIRASDTIHPRRIRRGLIEASVTVLSSDPASAPIPGEFAGASLKPVRAPGLGVRLGPHPRRIRRGLIEAPRSATGAPRSRGPIPGEFAGASLKRRGDGASSSGCRSIPGEFAGASLKHVHLRVDPRWDLTHPRRIRRGLIEATSCGAGVWLSSATDSGGWSWWRITHAGRAGISARNEEAARPEGGAAPDGPPAAPHTARIHATSSRGLVSWFNGPSKGIQRPIEPGVKS